MTIQLASPIEEIIGKWLCHWAVFSICYTARWHSHLPMISSIGGRVNLSRLDQLTDKPDIRLRRRFARIERHRTDQIETRA